MSFNKVIIMGNLGADPESRTTQTGTTVTNFSVATTERYKGEDKTEWHRVVAFGKVAEICAEYLGKGKQVLIEGKLQTRSWQDDTGAKRYMTEILANNVRFVGSGGSNGGSGATPAPKLTDDDIPF